MRDTREQECAIRAAAGVFAATAHLSRETKLSLLSSAATAAGIGTRKTLSKRVTIW